MWKIVRTIDVAGEDGRHYQVRELRAADPPASEPPARLETPAGEAVGRLAQGVYRLPSGVRLWSYDPTAP